MNARPGLPVYLTVVIVASLAATALIYPIQPAAQSTLNPIQIENGQTGTSDWRITNAASNHEIEGFATATSVNRGSQISFFVNTKDTSYTIEVFRMGWYGGLGGRRETQPVTLTGIVQPIPSPDPTTGLAECSWSNPYTLTTFNSADSTDWVSGNYLVKLTGSSGKQAYIIFVVRDDARSSNLLYQSGVTTSQAYNAWGGKSLYSYNSSGNSPAVKVSFNRPYDDGWGSGGFLSYELDALSYFESQGYDVTYSTDVDTHSDSAALTKHKGFLSIGHDEYWSYEMRQNVTAARDQGVSLAFFAANGCYWQIRFEPSLVDGTPNRTIVGYKENWQNDPDAQDPATYYLVTTRWRDPHVTLPGTPEDTLIGVMYNGYEPVSGDIVISNPTSWTLAGTGLVAGDHLSGLLGYEVDRAFSDSPSNLEIVAHTPYVFSGGHRSTQYSDMADYQAASGAWVFATGTMRWAWGLSNISPWGASTPTVSAAAQRITDNVLARFINGVTAIPSPTPTPTSTPTASPSPTPTASLTQTPTATPTPAAISLAPNSLTFATQTVGTTSPAQTVSLTNTSTASVAVSSITLSSGTNFAQTNTCLASLPPNTGCTISVVFKPTKPGALSDTLIVNAAGTRTVALSGKGAKR